MFRYLVSGGLLAASVAAYSAPIPITVFGNDYDQNFNTPELANSGSTGTALPDGWSISQSPYIVGIGSSTTGGIRSYGQNAQVDRALGSLSNGTGTLIFGAEFVNNGGGPITSLDIQYTGEQWRRGLNTVTDQLTFEYSLDALSITDGAATWTNVSLLNFVAPQTGTGGGFNLNGNLVANRQARGDTITGLNIANNEGFFIRFTDADVAGNDHGLAVDNFQLTAFTTVPEPGTLLLIFAGALGLVATRRAS